MSGLNYLGASATVVEGPTIPDPATRGGFALVVFAGDFADWDSPATNKGHFEPWLNELLKKVQQTAVANNLGTEGIQISAPRAGVGTLNGTTRETTSYTVTVYGRQVTQIETDPDDIVV